jgi:ArsR family transcriptional regulator
MSHHFSVLKGADLIRARCEGQQIYYALNTTMFQDLVAALLDLFGKDVDARGEDVTETRNSVG